MRPEAGRRERLSRGLYTLLTLAVPLLVGCDVYLQWHTLTLDFVFDVPAPFVVRQVVPGGQAETAGLRAGDVILTEDGDPFPARRTLQAGQTVTLAIERAGQTLSLALPSVRMARITYPYLVSAVVVVLTFWATGTLLLRRRFQHQKVRLFFLLTQTSAVALLFPLAHPRPWSPPAGWFLLSFGCLCLAAPLLLHYYATFPVRLGSVRQRRWGLGVLYALALLVAAGVIATRSRIALVWQLSVVLICVVISAALGCLIYVYLYRATSDGRRRLRLILFGTVLATVPPALFYLLPLSVGSGDPRLPEWLTGLFLILAPLSYLYATVQHNLFGIDRLLNRALVYTLLSLSIFLLYLGPLLLLYRLLPGDPLLQTMLVAGLTLLVGWNFDWMRTRVQRLVDRLFYGGWYDYPGVVETISEALTRSIERQQMADVLTRQVPALMQLRGAHLWIGEADETEPGNVPQPQLRFAFNFQGQRQGLWTVGPRRDGEGFADADRRILQTLARQAEIALSNVLLVETLRHQLDEICASRETLAQTQRQLLRSREEERARLARDLHDGPIQALVGLNLQLGLLLVPADGQDSLPLEELQTMRGEVRELLTELRQVCAELRPPMLDTLGLGAALRALADDWSVQCGVAVSLDLPSDATLRPLPDVVTVNLYRVVQEALSNVARHAAARSVAIQLAWEEPQLTLTLRDDGRGFVVPPTFHDLTAQGHFGLVGMQERLDLIGGAWTVESAPGQGTTVRAVWQKR